MRSNLQCLKAKIRIKLRASLKRLNPSERKKRSGRIVQKLLKLSEFKKAQRLMIYVSKSGEVETRQLIRKALKLKKKVFAPKMQAGALKIYEITNPSRDLKRGAYGILEPRARQSRLGRPEELDLIIAPGLGFDRRGRRLGRGRGYFDRFLAKAKRADKIGLSFKEQMRYPIPVSRQDIRMDRVITG